MATVPTLLIGLGGVGSSIVDKVYGWMKPEDRELLQVRVMDTDVNWIKDKLKNIREDFVVQTSDNVTVGYCLDRDPGAKEWFPYHPIINQKLLVNGAGQIRSVSRLALRAAMRVGKLKSLDRAIDSLMLMNPATANVGFRVLIVSSLVGGTGSGMFLQIPLYIRDLFREKGVQQVLIRGMFLLPDIFLETVPKSQHQNIKANAYAALKELNAITMVASGGDKNIIELEYRPDMLEANGIADHTINSSRMPYDFSFMFDKQNDLGQILPSTDAYLEQVAKCVYTQLASPIADGFYSSEDNEILSLMRHQGKNRFCGAATSYLQYPYDDIVNYCGARWVSDSLDESWLKMDLTYEQELKDYEQAKQRGDNIQKPERGQSYIRNFNLEVESDVAKPFFKELRKQVYQILADGNIGQSKSQLFLEEAIAYIAERINSDANLTMIESNCTFDQNRLKMEESTAINEISQMEDALRIYQQVIQDKVKEFRISIANSVIFGDVDSNPQKGYSDAAYRLNTWLLGRNEPIHPVGVRYLLYNLRDAIAGRLEAISTENDNQWAIIKKYDEAYDLNETEDLEDAETRYRLAARKYFLLKSFNRELPEFINEYITKSTKQLKALRKYKVSKLTEEVLILMQKHVNALINEFEIFFDNLKDIKKTMDVNIEQEAERHNRTADISTRYVLGERQHKEYLWNQIKNRLDQGMATGDIAKQMYLSLYRQAYQSLADERYERVGALELFQNNVVSFCQKYIREQEDSLNMDIYTALRKQAEIDGVPRSEEIGFVIKQIDSLTSRARPFVPRVSGVTEYANWGIHPSVLTKIPGDDIPKLFFGNKTVSERFSKYEIIRYQAYLGLTAENFPKFAARREGVMSQSTNGDYFEQYSQRVRLLNDSGSNRMDTDDSQFERSVTPHIDKRWHLPAYLPDLNEHIQNSINDDILRAFIKGLAYGWIRISEDIAGKIYKFIYSGETLFKQITKSGQNIGNRLDLLLEALSFYRVVVDEIVNRARKQEEEDCRNSSDPLQHRFFQGISAINLKSKKSKNIIDVLIEFRMDSPDNQIRQSKYQELIDATFKEIIDYCLKMTHNLQTAEVIFKELVAKLWMENQFNENTGVKGYDDVAMRKDYFLNDGFRNYVEEKMKNGLY